ncbi:MAG: lipoyl(octanoyl) transferase LipB [Candidatus Omnitrophica bacterium]|nr:lipoyl(octanoyl) transferase LipB [Candidatus Omnitrophota bacterium]
MELKIINLGLVDYKDGLEKQKSLFLDVKNVIISQALITCTHYPVITLGRSANKKNLLASQDNLLAKGIKTYVIERGGDITYHGPGQLMVYPIFNLNYLKKDIHWFLRKLEGVVISCLLDFGVKAQRVKGLTGVWVKEQKIASIGIAIKNWVTFHGLSINVKSNDLKNFELIRPCGMDITMTAVETCLKNSVDISQIEAAIIRRFKDDQSYSA